MQADGVRRGLRVVRPGDGEPAVSEPERVSYRSGGVLREHARAPAVVPDRERIEVHLGDGEVAADDEGTVARTVDGEAGAPDVERGAVADAADRDSIEGDRPHRALGVDDGEHRGSERAGTKEQQRKAA